MALVSVRPSPIALLGIAGAAWSIACGEAPPVPAVESVSPQRAYNDRSQRLLIHGGRFIPSYTLDPATGLRIGDSSGFSGRLGLDGRWYALHDLGWRSERELSASIDPGLPAGYYDVEVTDPRGQRALLRESFESLGPDLDDPSVEFETPDAALPVTAGSTISGRFVVRERPPGRLETVGWEVLAADRPFEAGLCPLIPDASQVVCHFRVTVPIWLAEKAPFELVAYATDRPGDPPVVARVPFLLRGKPNLERIIPEEGGVAGGTDVVILGSGFVRGSKILVDEILLLPDGGVIVDENTITGRIPKPRYRENRTADIVLRGPIGDILLPAVYRYRMPPKVDAVFPAGAPPEGGTPLRIRGSGFDEETRIYFGDELSSSASLLNTRPISAVEIVGDAPAGRGRTSVWAFHPRYGWDQLADAFGWSSP